MTRFDHVKEILDQAVNFEVIGGHGAFWRAKSRTQFVQARIFGLPLLVIGQPAESNMIKALRGLAPFGEDTGTPGGMYRRMPAGRAAMPEDNIRFLEQWIAEGCLEDEWPPAPGGAQPQGPMTDQQINSYFRALDSWSLSPSSDEVQAAVGTFFTAVNTWFALTRGEASEADWSGVLHAPEVEADVELLGAGQERIVRQFFGNPLLADELAVAYERFGEASLPPDPLRPMRDHRMDGAVMWFIWLAFAEAARTLGREASFWEDFTRAIFARRRGTAGDERPRCGTCGRGPRRRREDALCAIRHRSLTRRPIF
jgi:hypothetical protein